MYYMLDITPRHVALMAQTSLGCYKHSTCARAAHTGPNSCPDPAVHACKNDASRALGPHDRVHDHRRCRGSQRSSWSVEEKMSNLRHEIATEHAVNAGAMGWAGCVRASLHAPERSQKPRNARDDRAPKGRPEGSRTPLPPV